MKVDTLWYAQTWRICRLQQIHNNFQNPLAIPNKHRIFSLGSKEAFCCYSINISNCQCKRKFSKCQVHADFIVSHVDFTVNVIFYSEGAQYL